MFYCWKILVFFALSDEYILYVYIIKIIIIIIIIIMIINIYIYKPKALMSFSNREKYKNCFQKLGRDAYK